MNAPTSLYPIQRLRRRRTARLIVTTAMLLLAIVTTAGAARLLAGARGDQRPDAGQGRKRSRTAAESKMTAALLDEIARMKRPEPKRPPPHGLVTVDRRNRALVDIRAVVGRELQQQIKALGGVIVSTSSRYDTTIAWVPVLRLEQLASLSLVRSITPAAEPQRNNSHEMRK